MFKTIPSPVLSGLIGIIIVAGCICPKNVHSYNDRSPENTINAVNGNNHFALDLYSKYKSKEGNIFFSPYSISSALAITYEGARGRTAEEMQKALHFPGDKQKMRSGFLNLYDELNKPDKPYKLTTANALWVQTAYPFLNDYISLVERFYGGKVTNLDFKSDTNRSRQTINDWVEMKTNDKIKNLIPPDTLNPLTKLLLTNAIYFKGNWSKQFDPSVTADEEFRLSSGTNVTVKMMHQVAYFNYGETRALQILEMSYPGNDLSMIIILPKDNDLGNVERSISTDGLANWVKDMKIEEVVVSLPKFKFETKYFMANDLKEMGMPMAFSAKANFTGMSLKKGLYINEVIHQAFVEVSESGTEAAAATAVGISATATAGPKPKPKIFNANHPFIFIIQHKDTGNILFLGRTSDPSK